MFMFVNKSNICVYDLSVGLIARKEIEKERETEKRM